VIPFPGEDRALRSPSRRPSARQWGTVRPVESVVAWREACAPQAVHGPEEGRVVGTPANDNGLITVWLLAFPPPPMRPTETRSKESASGRGVPSAGAAEDRHGGGLTPELLDASGAVTQTLMLSTNQVGSVQLVTDAATGSVVQRIEYDEFGRVLTDSAPGIQPFGFAGGLYDSATKLVRFGARDYSGEVGIWSARDSILFEGGDNLYAFVEADPLNRLDPDGHVGAAITIITPYLVPAIQALVVACVVAWDEATKENWTCGKPTQTIKGGQHKCIYVCTSDKGGVQEVEREAFKTRSGPRLVNLAYGCMDPKHVAGFL
jgi:RHS repeat-associated protein